MPFVNENLLEGLPENDRFQVGRSDVDSGKAIEDGIGLSYPADPEGCYFYYECTVEVELDSGIVVHRQLPQVDNAPDTLAAVDYADSELDTLEGGVNLKSNDQYTDIVQRMAHSKYRFNLKGRALRIGRQVPIPGLVSVGGVEVVPDDKVPQRAFNRIAPGGNYGGLVLWHAEWSLWYTVVTPTKDNTIPASDPSAHFDPELDIMQAPLSPVDDASTKAPPTTLGQGSQER